MTRSTSPTPPQKTTPVRDSMPAPATPGPQLFIKGDSHPGRVRDHNEDFLLTPDRAQVPPAARQQRGELVVVADGMGGHAAGEVAARMAAERVMQGYYGSQTDPKTALLDAIQQANAEVFHAQQRNAAQEGMGSTLAAAIFLPGRVVMASVGDSRIYRLRGGRIEQLTTDHTWVNEKLRSREITADEANTHPYRSVITRAMGAALSVSPDPREEILQPGDVYLLCSDGLSNMVSEEDLRQILGNEGPQPAVMKLINLANSRGGPDNITAAVISYGVGEGATVVGAGGKSSSRAILFGAAGAVALAVLVLLFLLLRQPPVPPPDKEPAAVDSTGTAAVVAAAATITLTVASSEVVRPTSTLAVSSPSTATPAPSATPRPAGPTHTPVRSTAPPPAQPLPAPLLSQPAPGHTADQGSLRFVWQEVPGAAAYRVETRSDRQGQEDWRQWPSGESTELTLDFLDPETALYFSIPGTLYEWRVAGLDRAGRLGSYSELRRFEFNRPTPVPPTPLPPPPP